MFSRRVEEFKREEEGLQSDWVDVLWTQEVRTWILPHPHAYCSIGGSRLTVRNRVIR